METTILTPHLKDFFDELILKASKLVSSCGNKFILDSCDLFVGSQWLTVLSERNECSIETLLVRKLELKLVISSK